MNPDAVQHCYESIKVHSRSFHLASRFLPAETRDRAVVLYAWCRRADDVVDLERGEAARRGLLGLEGELEAIYAGVPANGLLLQAFAELVQERGIPRVYPQELLAGFGMDVEGRSYETLETLYQYCYRVAGVVGSMMCHVMGLREDRALRNAVHLGMAMQLTNICRDFEADWEMGRLYIPEELLERTGAGGLSERRGEVFPPGARAPVAQAIQLLLNEADAFYRSGDQGLGALAGRCALAIRIARHVYAGIGERIRRRGCDPLVGRAVVSRAQKLRLVARAGGQALGALTDRRARVSRSAQLRAPRTVLRYPQDVLPVGEP